MGIEQVKWAYARKEYTCMGCGETIPEGARYQSGVKKDGGRLVRVPLCERCSYAATNKVLANNLPKLDIEPGMFAWNKLNSKFRNWWRELMETRQHETELMERLKGKL